MWSKHKKKNQLNNSNLHSDSTGISHGIRSNRLTGQAQDNFSSKSNKVHFQSLGDEGKRAGHSDVTLDNLEVVLLGYDLEVEGPGHL